MSNADIIKRLPRLDSPLGAPDTPRDKLISASVNAEGADLGLQRTSRSTNADDPVSRSRPAGKRGQRPRPTVEGRATPDFEEVGAPTDQISLPDGTALASLPQRRGRGSIGGLISFVLCVLLPTALAAIYYIGFASNQYVTGFHFAVRTSNTATSTSTATSSLTAMLGISSSTNSAENYMVADYIMSRQAVDDLQAKIAVKQLYALPSVDWWSRFDASLPIENFLRYWRYVTTATYDEITGTGVVQIRAFTPEDAYLIANTLIELSEDLVNEVAQRPQREAVQYAESELTRAESRLKKIRAELAEYRNKESLIDPTSSVVLGNATLSSALRTSLAQIQTDLAAAQSQKLNPNAPSVLYLKSRLKATQEQLAAVEAEVRTAKEGTGPLSQVVAQYEQLDLERQFAQNMVISTMQSLEQARSNAMSKRIFITPYVRPVLPETSLYPNRFVAILTVAGACLLLWTIALLLARSIREHLA